MKQAGTAEGKERLQYSTVAGEEGEGRGYSDRGWGTARFKVRAA